MTTPSLALVAPDQARAAVRMAALRLRVRNRTQDVHAWRAKARPPQLPPDGPWTTWYLMGGRGGGKTWAAGHTFAEWVWEDPGEYGIVAPTYADGRDICIEGESGLLAAFGTNRAEVERGGSRYVESWNRSMGELRLRNGSVVYVDGADDGATRIQGHNLKACWCSEIGLWRKGWRTAWEESVRYAVRKGRARILADGTPKRGHPIVRQLVNDPTVPKSRVKTMDNLENLNPSVVQQWVRLYGGTTLGRQELEGEVLEDVPGAAWKRDWIDRFRLTVAPLLDRVTVGIDPAATSSEGSDETGLVVAGAALVSPQWCKEVLAAGGVDIVPDSHGTRAHEHYFVIDDQSDRLTPSAWGERAVALYRTRRAGKVVAEVNRGGEMVEHTVRTVDQSVAFESVKATRGKAVRAEPIAALYEQGKVHHIGPFALLEDQQCSYVVGDPGSPDRMDALVWALTDLAIQDEPGLLGAYRNQAATKAAEKAAAERTADKAQPERKAA